MVRLGSHKFKRRHQYHKRNTYLRMDASWWTDSMLAIAASWCVVAVVEEESVVRCYGPTRLIHPAIRNLMLVILPNGVWKDGRFGVGRFHVGHRGVVVCSGGGVGGVGGGCGGFAVAAGGDNGEASFLRHGVRFDLFGSLGWP